MVGAGAAQAALAVDQDAESIPQPGVQVPTHVRPDPVRGNAVPPISSLDFSNAR
jgi:hypothetical protein